MVLWDTLRCIQLYSKRWSRDKASVQSWTMPAFNVMVEKRISKFIMLFIRNYLLSIIIHLKSYKIHDYLFTYNWMSLKRNNLNLKPLHSRITVDDKRNVYSRWCWSTICDEFQPKLVQIKLLRLVHIILNMFLKTVRVFAAYSIVLLRSSPCCLDLELKACPPCFLHKLFSSMFLLLSYNKRSIIAFYG